MIDDIRAEHDAFTPLIELLKLGHTITVDGNGTTARRLIIAYDKTERALSRSNLSRKHRWFRDRLFVVASLVVVAFGMGAILVYNRHESALLNPERESRELQSDNMLTAITVGMNYGVERFWYDIQLTFSVPTCDTLHLPPDSKREDVARAIISKYVDRSVGIGAQQP